MFDDLRRVLPVFLAILTAAGAASAFTGESVRSDLEIPRSGWGDEGRWIAAAEPHSSQLKTSPLTGLVQRHGGNWRVSRNIVTG